MHDYHFKLFVKLYLVGKQIQGLIKKHNTDLLSQWVILTFLSSHPQTASELSEQLGIKISAMSSRINQMEAAGLLKRISGHDKRSNIAQITEQGTALLTSFRNKMKQRCATRPLPLSKKDTEQLVSLLSAIKLEDL
jgi:DNA-binding MarR family transcriptional regulator